MRRPFDSPETDASTSGRDGAADEHMCGGQGGAVDDGAGRGPGETRDAMVADLLGRYWRPLVAYAIRLLEDEAAAEDIVQRAFVRIWENSHEVPAGDGERPFLYRVVRNLAANEWRRQRNHMSWVESQPEQGSMPVTPDEELAEGELAALLARAVERLPARRREVFVLSRYHGMTNIQIADILSISPQTVANQLVSALRTLRGALAPLMEDESFPPLRIVRDDGRIAG